MKKTVVKTLLLNSDGLALILYRSDSHPNFPGHLDLPGGELENSDTIESTVVRELEEETGIKALRSGVNYLFKKEYEDVIHVLCTQQLGVVTPKIKLSWEHKDNEWMKLTHLNNLPTPDNTDKYFLDVLEHLRST
jgi:8-oxo-dGTP pyrophosphatase MutT (NUDIX family)